MTVVLILLLVNGVLGAWDTLWYHEYRARLAEQVAHARTELRLHVTRDAVYVLLYGGLALGRPGGWWVGALGLALAIEIAATLADFVVEDRDRPAIGGLAPGERILHTVMAIIYGAMLANLFPLLTDWATEDTALLAHDAPLPLRVATLVFAFGIAATGTRDALALAGCDPVTRYLPSPA